MMNIIQCKEYILVMTYAYLVISLFVMFITPTSLTEGDSYFFAIVGFIGYYLFGSKHEYVVKADILYTVMYILLVPEVLYQFVKGPLLKALVKFIVLSSIFHVEYTLRYITNHERRKLQNQLNKRSNIIIDDKYIALFEPD